MRVFVAIDMPDPVLEALEKVQEHLPVGRLMTPDTLHLTLAFLDQQPDAALVALDEELQALKAPAFDLQLRGLGTFGNRSPSVLWAGVVPNPALTGLRNDVRRAARRAGIDLPRERFRPHVTLARYGPRLRGDELERLRRFLERWGDVTLPGFGVEQVTLFNSMRRAEGAVHEVLAEYPLTGSAASEKHAGTLSR